jgi:restriction endonuclease Mrr
MAIPSRKQLDRAIPELLNKKGEMSISDVYEALANHFALSLQERLAPMSGKNQESHFKNAVRQARRDFVTGGLMSRNTPRGIWKLTRKGERFAEVLSSLKTSRPTQEAL